MAWGVDEVDGVVFVLKRDGGAFHGDGAPLFLVEIVHEPEAAGEFRVDDAGAGSSD